MDTKHYRPNTKDLAGKIFGRLEVIRRHGSDAYHRAVWLCRCICGQEKLCTTHALTIGQTKSCGCLSIDKVRARSLRHGHYAIGSETNATFETWKHMHARCKNESDVGYHNYGGRGIAVCERWEDFGNFLVDMGRRPEGTSIERKDNDGNYEPSNCVWATPKEQGNNNRRNVHVTLSGVTLPVSEWAARLKIKPQTIYCRLLRGSQPKDALRPFSIRR